MYDQADELRQLVLRAAAMELAPDAPPPPMVVVSGGKGGVGATTIAVNMAVAMARQGLRAVLVDADFNQPDATAYCHLDEGESVADVLAGRRTVHEVLQRGPAGLQVLPGAWAKRSPMECSPLAQQRLLNELSRLGAHADVIVLDVGSGSSEIVGRFWHAADLVLVAATNDAVAIMDAYASIKMLGGDKSIDVRIVVNKAVHADQAADVHNRIAMAARRFLDRTVDASPHIPWDEKVLLSGQDRRPFILDWPAANATAALETISQSVLATVGVVARSSKHGRGAARSRAA